VQLVELSRVYYSKLFRGGEAHVGGIGGDRMTREKNVNGDFKRYNE
jgi:hypothetical protein